VQYNYKSIFESLQDGVYFVDLDRRITYWNKAAERITGYSEAEVVGARCMDNVLIHIDERGTTLCKGLCPLMAAMEDGNARQAEVYLHHKRGHRVPVSVRATPLRDKAGKIIGGVELFSDISSKKALQDKIRELEKLALIDSLTGLSNRKHIEGELIARFHEKVRYGLDFGVLFMDIDHFKEINDKFGHACGDAVLKTISETFKASTRSYDLVGRWGGEEFIGIIRNVDYQLLGKVGERFRMLVEKTRIENSHHPISVTISVGATLAVPEDTPESVIARADEYLYKSKRNGRNRLTICEFGKTGN